MFSHLHNDTLHHAYLIEGDTSIVLPNLIAQLESLGVSILHNPNVYIGTYESFLIDDAHDIRARQIERTEDGGKKIFIISTQFMNHHAQNALLKTFEEPALNTHFFLIMPSISSLYDTLISRFSVIRSDASNVDTSESKEFLSLPIEKRFLLIADIVKAHEDDENSGGIRSHSITLVSGIETLLYKSISNKDLKSYDLVFTDLSNARQYLSIAGASVKMILEQLALSVPIIK